jgi:hypothetical protein
VPGDDKETLVDRWTRYLKNQPILAVLIVVGVVLGGLASFTDSIGRLAKMFAPTPQTAEVSECLLSGVVFDSDSNKPLSAIYIDLYQSDPHQRPITFKRAVATTGPDGKFSFDCKWITKSQFPIRLGVSHPDWVFPVNGPEIERPVRWDGINIPVRMTRVKLKPLREISVSFTVKRSGDDRLIAGEIQNTSSRSFACIKLEFRLQGEQHRDLGVIDVEVRNLGPGEKRSYESAKLPGHVGFYLLSKEECSQ